jgi:cobalt/nickel transport system permease protein
VLLAPKPFHIPDGFISPLIAGLGWLLAVVVISMALRQTRKQLGERQVPLMGILAAFIFAAQAINFPIAGGTSGHLLGGALAAIVMGPWAAALIMTAVVSVQALIFQDGGLLALGWNIVNMGVLSAFTGYLSYYWLRKKIGPSTSARVAASFAAAWLSMEVGAIATAIELALSNTSPLSVTLPTMVAVHAVIGLGEGLITSGAVRLLQVARPELFETGERTPGALPAAFIVSGLLLAILVAGFSPLASTAPDGLEYVAEQSGFLHRAKTPLFNLLPDYSASFITHPALATISAVMIGTLLVFSVTWIVGRRAARKEV